MKTNFRFMVQQSLQGAKRPIRFLDRSQPIICTPLDCAVTPLLPIFHQQDIELKLPRVLNPEFVDKSLPTRLSVSSRLRVAQTGYDKFANQTFFLLIRGVGSIHERLSVEDIQELTFL